MAGLIQNQLSTGYIPKEYELDPNKDMVEGRIQNIVSSGSPLMKMAETNAKQAMNSRGLLNSSMAIGEGQKAVYSAALPIASQDANTSVNVGLKNVDTVNRAREFGATGENQFGLQKMQGDQRIGEIQLAGDIDIQKMNLDSNLKQDIMKFDADLKSKASQDDNAAKYYSQYMAGVSEILKMENVTTARKAELIAKLGDTATAALNLTTVLGGIDFTQYLSSIPTTPKPAEPGTAAQPAKPKYDPERYQQVHSGFRTKFVDKETGTEYTLAQMREMYPDAFPAEPSGPALNGND